ncbi:hypothetical protein SAMN06265371_11211 [Lutibacter agarilyticus]|uniref:Uncharacterized protein n=1 Tax=Lutibacter agarilyticus TaxID=1109740 RepID=A0A238Z2E6_9FLAO|nr:hypothetical protein SAMN06265371_11211 [Lutibacter agarilyticus]
MEGIEQVPINFSLNSIYIHLLLTPPKALILLSPHGLIDYETLKPEAQMVLCAVTGNVAILKTIIQSATYTLLF